ncbi:ABC transporter substrate-binding protein [Halorubellus sp. JP-L1]|uniref:ABC transporter substrate-binding protein n=1 Tax=Halorubellus sp. JP-L1 TaxID=2715753 RepID=UPI0019653BB7
MQSLSASAAAGLAGCQGMLGGGEDGESGERVPKLVLEYWAGRGGTSKIFEDTAPMVQDAAEELGMELEIKPVEFTTQIGHTSGDMRTHDISYWQFSPVPDRLDPDEFCRRFTAGWAGGNGKHNPSNFVNCDVTEPSLAQASASSQEERQELVSTSQERLTENFAAMPVAAKVGYSAYRTDEVDLDGAGSLGIARTNPDVYAKSTPTNGDEIIAYTSPEMVQTSNFAVISSSASQGVWNQLVHSPLVGYDSEFNLENRLAKNYEVTNDGKTVTVELKDATFHNGDPITAEDVKFTFEQLAANTGVYTQASEPPYDSIEVLNEKTAEFNFTESFLPIVSRVWPRWGIFHKDSWVEAGAEDDPENVELDPIVGSGPFKVANFETDSELELEPHDGNPVYDVDHRIVFTVYRDVQSMFQAFKANEVDMVSQLSPGVYDQVSDMDNGEQVGANYHTPFSLFPQFPKPPMKFEELRHALGKALDRKKMNAVGFLGESEPELAGTLFTKNHPNRPSEDSLTKYTDDPTGDVEGAKQLLEDAGYTTDGDEQLHYPPDKDLSPRWPAEETPDPEDFPCLEG